MTTRKLKHIQSECVLWVFTTRFKFNNLDIYYSFLMNMTSSDSDLRIM